MESTEAALTLAAEIAGLRTDTQEAADEFRSAAAESRAAAVEFGKATVAAKKNSRTDRIAIGVVLLLVVGFGWLALSNRSTAHAVAKQAAVAKAQADCLRTYNNASAARSNVLVQPNIDQQFALADAIRSTQLGPQPPSSAQQAATQRKVLIYLQKWDVYMHLVQAHPLPLAPRYAC